MESTGEELLKKIRKLEVGQAQLKQEMSKLVLPPTGSFAHSSPLQREGRAAAEGGATGAGLPERQYRRVLQSLGQSVHILDLDGRIIYWNRSAENLYGYPASEVLGQDALMLLMDSRDLDVVNDMFRRISLGESWTGKFPVKNRAGNRFLSVGTNTPFYDEDGSLVGIICVSSDSRALEEILNGPSTSARSDSESSRPTCCDGSCSNSNRKTSLLNISPFDSQHPLQSTIASKITNLATKVTNKVRSRVRLDENGMVREGGSGESQCSDRDAKEEPTSSGPSTPRGDAPCGAFATEENSPGKSTKTNSDESGEGKIGGDGCSRILILGARATKMEDPDAASPQPAMDDPDASSLQAAMEVPITASLGPTGPLLRKLHSLMAPEHGLPDWLTADEIRLLRDGLKVLCISLNNLSEAEDASLTAKWWMKLVRELCYDTEVYLDEVMHPDDGARRSACLSTIFWIQKRLKRRPQFAMDFSELMARVKDASGRYQMFELGLLAEKRSPPKTINPDLEQAGVSHLMHKLSTGITIPVHGDTSGRSIVGVEEPMNKLVNFLLPFDDDDQKQLKVAPIFGSAGVGKTTVARTLYHKYGGKFQCRAFVGVSRNPDMRRLLTSILSQIKAPRPHGFPDVTDLIDGIRKHLQGKRYFIVMDDLWTASAWDIISRAFPHGDYCSRIITTTQIDDVAMACCSYCSEHIHEMSPLNDDESRKLFFGRVFGSEDRCPTDMKEVSYEIIRKCGGLPLAIVNIASLLANEPIIVREKWKHVQDCLSSTSEGMKDEPNIVREKRKHVQDSVSSTSEGMKDVLNVTYNSLPPRLKTCLLYLSMYPEGYPIGKHDLVKQWIGEGFLSAVEGRDTEQLAEGYFDELVSRGMVQAVDANYNGDVSCTVHHMILDLIRWKSMEDNFITIVDNFQSTLGLPDKVRRLSVQFGGAKGAKIPENIVISHVRSLIFSGFIKGVPPIMDYRFLRVLALHIWVDQDKTSFDLRRIHQLFRLRYLKIECNVNIKLPAKIRRLQYLGTLEVDAGLSVVPSDIVRSQSLLHLCLPSQANLPAGIGHMTSLRSLGYFNLSNNSRDNVLGLGKLINLWDLRLTCSTVESNRLVGNIKHLGSILGKLSKLKSLILDAGASSLSISCDGLNSVSPAPALLERLELPRICIFRNLPMWFRDLNKLCILKIAVEELSEENIDILKELPALTALSLYVWITPTGGIVFGKEGFRALRYFKFRCTAPCLTFQKGAMPNVQRLKLRFDDNGLEQYDPVHAGFEHLLGLEEISAKIGSVGADEYDSKAALWTDVFSELPSSPIFNMQLGDRIFNGDREKSSARNVEKHQTKETVQDVRVEVRSNEQYVIQAFAGEGTSKQAEADSGTLVASGSSLQT